MGALRNMNKDARKIAKEKFEQLLDSGAFPKVEWKKIKDASGFTSTSYAMMEYSTVWATFTKVIQDRLIEKGFEFGLWQNARNKVYLAAVLAVTSGIEENQVNENNGRFTTMFG